MSTGLTTVQRIEFDSQVKAAYQKGGLLRRYVRVKSNVVGATARFRRSGKGMATRRIPQTDVVPMGSQYAEIPCTLEDWNAPEYTDVFDQAKTDVQERGIVANNIAKAIGRREDQLILDALDAANASANIVHASVGMTYAKALRAMSILDDRGVEPENRIMAISARAKEDLLSDNRFISTDFIEGRSVETGQITRRVLGFTWVVIESRNEGGLPIASNIRTMYAFDGQAIGLAIGIDMRTSVDWIAEKTSYLANGLFSAGATYIDPDGVVEIQSQELPA